MKPTHTAIAAALAVAVVVMIYLFPGFSPFGSVTQGQTPASAAQSTSTQPEQSMPTQLQATDETIGTGATAAAGDTVTVNYVGMLTNGTIFDASANHGSAGFTFTLGAGQVIKGWDEGIVGMKEGGKRRLVLPPDLAYGSQAVGNIIPANSTLVFEVELVKVQKAQ